ncbi:amidohydrolase family protein [Allostreptomyces psammosilenae]|uniref:Cytosine/adenosine deaminase-related metal-dependent hydrolase n=1 Tax=Allostreptomyces psammosilenae TaxID=1892865 RepID=A0A852ZX43_9ACTN|nr:amidohydrolase family protein [Allostreptomyces psammosilenae]NYI05820.1 cytosine/adenosine deaminase-related metal-dependent hydrolase [Allostreptomyces psammosilenae]
MLTIHAAPVVLSMVGGAGAVRDGAVAVEGAGVVAVGEEGELRERFPRARVRRWPGVLMPGLVNAHAHLQYSDFAELAAGDLAFPEWIRRLSAMRARFDATAWQESTRRGIHALLRTGTTAAADVVTDPEVLVTTARSGLAGVSYLEVVSAGPANWAVKREALLGALASAPAGRRLGLSPHTPYTVGTDAFRECVAIARGRGLRLHPHLAETPEEAEYVLSGSGALAGLVPMLELEASGGCGLTPPAYLDGIGALGPDVHVAHGTHCAAEDRKLLAARGTAVAVCVRSNALLGAGEPPLADYLAEGVPLAVGTDSLASTPSLDLWEEALAARDLARRQGYASPDLERRLVEAMTRGGAAAMGLGDGDVTEGAIGVLRPGARADLAVFDVSVPPGADPWGVLVEGAAGRCVATVLGGRLVHRRA